ncbi:MAG: class I SAM-dependent methyltransferase [Pseudorhodobacter sp.]|nr:class I SAM-dependent methyltransferase [Pseudorhodobacter sp.]
MMDATHAEYYEADSFWDGKALKDPGNQRRIETTADLIPAEVKSVLDVGCGNGIFGHHLLEVRKDIKFLGVDRSKSALRHVKFDAQVASIDALPFEDDSFDAVSCLQVIEHIPNASYRKSLEELARVARDYIIIGVPFEEDLTKETTTCPQCRTVFNIDFHMRNYDLPTVKALFCDFGFEFADHEFPTQKVRTKYIDDWSAALRGRNRKTDAFRSPICPVCGYTEGDKTALNHSPGSSSPTGRRPFYKNVVIKTLHKVLPKEAVNGYWIVALFKRSKAS